MGLYLTINYQDWSWVGLQWSSTTYYMYWLQWECAALYAMPYIYIGLGLHCPVAILYVSLSVCHIADQYQNS